MNKDDETSNTKKILIIGNSPLPHENVEKTFAPGIRTWNFATAVNTKNSFVKVIGCRIPFVYPTSTNSETFEKIDDIEYLSVNGKLFENLDWLKNEISKFKPDCIIGVNAYPCSIISNLDLEVPFWADLNGATMAEAQAKSYVYNDDKYIRHFFEMEKRVLEKADIFSVVSESQGFSLLGELGLVGRLNKNTMGNRMVRVIPNTMTTNKFSHTKNIIRGIKTEEDDFIILYSGGYNSWTDVHTMFHGLVKAMLKNPKIIFVSTGGAIDGHDELTYDTFKKLIQSSKLSHRFILCGWVLKEDVQNYYFEADLAINSDRYSYEAILGARTRVLDWIQIPLPFISTSLSDITNYLIKKGLSIGFKPGDIDDLAQKILFISNNQNILNDMKQSLEEIKEEFSGKYVYDEFKNWVIEPTFSPDKGIYNNLILSIMPKKITNEPEHLAVRLWPKILSILKFLHLQKYENKLKKFGYGIITKKSPIYKAKFSLIEISILESNKKYKIPITIQNVGDVKWIGTESDNPVNLSYIWKNIETDEIIKFEERTTIPKSIDPKEKISLEMKLTTPKTIGKFLLEIDLLKENEFWFSDVGSIPKTFSVEIKKKQQFQSDPKISVIVVSFNSEKYIKKCINSILSNKYKNLELIVIDNNSNDDTLSEINNLNYKLKLIKNKTNVGFGMANNIGIENSSGEIILLVNPDAYLNDDSISNLIKPFLFDEKIMIAGPKILYPDSNIIQSAGGKIEKNGLTNHYDYKKIDDNTNDFQHEVDYVTGAVMAIRRSLFKKIGLFDPVYFPAYYEETEKCLQTTRLGYKVVYVPDSVAYHYESTTIGALSDSFLKLFHTNRFRFVYRNYSFSKFISKFIPSELFWFFLKCPPKERNLVVKCHLRALFSH